MLDWIKRLLNLALPEQLAEIERREPSLEERLERLLRRLGSYSNRRADELAEIMADIEAVLDIVERSLRPWSTSAARRGRESCGGGSAITVLALSRLIRPWRQ